MNKLIRNQSKILRRVYRKSRGWSKWIANKRGL